MQEGDEDGSKDGEGDGAKGKKQREGFWRPDEHRALFAGNCDDQCRLGIKLTRYATCLLDRVCDNQQTCRGLCGRCFDWWAEQKGQQ